MNKPILPSTIFIQKNAGPLIAGIVILFLAILFSSCKTPQNAYYFKDINKDMTISNPATGEAELKIAKNDLLMINVSSLNQAEDMVYNAPSVLVGSGNAGSTSSTGYKVDAEGNIQFHRLGVLHVEGLTRAALKNKIQKDLAAYLKDMVVTVRYLNHSLTVLGEVVKPQVIPMPEEKISLLEVLGASGDVTQFAKRDNILVIRETGNGKQFKRINLEDQSIFSSEWYWLQPGDVVYVGPNDKKINEEQRAKRQQTISIALSALSVAIIVLDRIIK